MKRIFNQIFSSRFGSFVRESYSRRILRFSCIAFVILFCVIFSGTIINLHNRTLNTEQDVERLQKNFDEANIRYESELNSEECQALMEKESNSKLNFEESLRKIVVCPFAPPFMSDLQDAKARQAKILSESGWRLLFSSLFASFAICFLAILFVPILRATKYFLRGAFNICKTVVADFTRLEKFQKFIIVCLILIVLAIVLR